MQFSCRCRAKRIAMLSFTPDQLHQFLRVGLVLVSLISSPSNSNGQTWLRIAALE